MMMDRSTFFVAVALVAGPLLLAGQQPPPTPPPQIVQPTEGALVLRGVTGAPKLAVPDFIALTTDAESKAIAATIGEVLWQDLAFEREFYLIPRDTYSTIPAANSIDAVPFDRWKELGAEGVVVGTVRKTATGVTVQVRLFNIGNQQAVFGKEYAGSVANPRLYAHTISDEIHRAQRNLAGVARTRLAFSSDRDGERQRSSYLERGTKEIYIADYDGANPRRITANRSLNIFPVWSADGKALAYTSYRRNNMPDIFVSYIYEGRPPETPAKGTERVHNFLPAWSPDGSKIAFMTNRDGNPEIYVINRDGSGVRRLTNHPNIDATPTWSPSGNQVAFTSDRSGSPQIYVMDADGLGQPRRITTLESWADRATWAPAPHNEIAFASRTGPGYDIKIYDMATGDVRQITNGEGSNESPAYSPTGRHLAFTSTRLGKQQIFTIGRDGNGLRQITREGNNFHPSWSR
jgi:TolB protein